MKKREFILSYFLIALGIIFGFFLKKDTIDRTLVQLKSFFGIEEINDEKNSSNSDAMYLDLIKFKSDWINVKQPPFNLPGDGSDQTFKLQELFNLANEGGSVYLYFPEGNYGMSGYLRLYKNTFVQMHDNARITRIGSGNKVFINGEFGNTSYARQYNGEGNIHFTGGTINLNAKATTIEDYTGYSAFDLGHAENITLNNITIENGQNGHYLQIASCKDIKIKNCYFKNQINTNSKLTFEAIQIEMATKDSFPTFGAYDETVSSNIIIEKCKFENIIRAIGTHGTGDVIHCENLRILCNDFKNSVDNMLNLTSYRNLNVENNIISKAGGYAIYMVSTNESLINGNMVIESEKSGLYIRSSNNNQFNNNIYKDPCLSINNNNPAILIDNSNYNIFEGDSVISSKPRYSYAFYLKNGGLGNRVVSRNFIKGTIGLLNGSDVSEMNNLEIGLGQKVLFEGGLSEKGETASLIEDIRSFNFIVVVGNDIDISQATMTIPKTLYTIGTEQKFRLVLNNDNNKTNNLEFSLPTYNSIRIVGISGVGQITKIIGMV